MNAELVEERTNEFFLRGEGNVTCIDFKTVEVEGEIYSKSVFKDVLIDLHDVDYANKTLPAAIEGMFNIHQTIVSIAPFFTVKINYLAPRYGLQHIDDVFSVTHYKFNDGTRCDVSSSSTVMELNVLRDICSYNGIWVETGKCSALMANYIRENNQMMFTYTTDEFSSYSKAVLGFRFIDVLNMDPKNFTEYNLRMLKLSCNQYPIIKESLNYDVFERELTDLEKIACAQKYISFLSNSKKTKRQINRRL